MSDERKWLFTDSDSDLRGNLAAKAFLDTAQAAVFMNVENYDSKVGDERAKDVSHEVADFVVDSALFHKAFDAAGKANGLNDAMQFKVYQKVFGRWNSLSEESRNFYSRFLNMMKKDAAGNWIETNSYADALNNKSNFRINLKKDAKNGNVEVGLHLPLVSDKLSRYIWFRESPTVVGGAPTPLTYKSVTTTGNEIFFRKLYQAVYSGAAPAQNVHVARSNNTLFNINVDNLVRSRMFAISKAEVKEELAEEPMGDSFVDMIDRDVIRRDADGKLYRMVDDKKVLLGAEDEHTRKVLKSAHDCYSTGVKAGDDEQCKKFIFECLLSQDADSLNNCLIKLRTNLDFFKVAVDDIKNIHPVLALRILQQFGFRKYQVQDAVAGMPLWKVESVKHWLENYMAKKFKAADVRDMIKQNDQHYLLDYLSLVSQYVNANPAILNKNYSGSSDEVVGRLVPSAYGASLGLSFEVPRRAGDRFRMDIGRLGANLKLIRSSRNPIFVAQNNRRFLSTPWGSSLTPGVSMLTPMRGGSNCDQNATIYVNSHGGTALLEQFLNTARAKLKARGKSLNAKDEERIQQHIKKNKEIEKELVKTYCYIDEYNQLLDVLGDTSSKMLSRDKLMQIVNRQDGLLGKQGASEEQIMQILSKLLEFVGEEGEDLQPIKASDALGN